MAFLLRMPKGTHLPTLALTLALGTGGGFVARAVHLPLPMLLGSLLAVAAAALAGLKPFGRLPQFPPDLRLLFVPIIGVAIGGNFTPQIVAEARLWWPSLVALCLYIPVAHLLGYRALRATGKLDPITTFFGTAPGGLVETVMMGEEMGADVAMLTMLQFLRLILTIIVVPLGFTIATGHAVGSAGGASLVVTHVLSLADWGWILGAAALGLALGRASRLPAGVITGPILVSAAMHLSGLSDASPPLWSIMATQIVIGTSLGVRFAGMPLAYFALALRLAAVNVTIFIALAAVFAVALADFVHEPVAAVFLAFAPGGLTEMALIALSLQMSVIYVTAHHVLRIVLAVALARGFAARVRR
ncbi:AbrB family transcriptional regulator [Phaeovulum sp.]|uniref:AbrB family transcriptional regulator n=1 Tax=Phaeovulum sp. TaxID=2934796 RepID=UPI0027308530|nr:AbrB family transcriptional regulator [Phaeovulum sp.]MDP1668242.1 AbrB family transcriptional regulator [Phaeovulum sp.]MDZ4118090.1 AbrB family transcriptional regulator [Phaeovulum sp.]